MPWGTTWEVHTKKGAPVAEKRLMVAMVSRETRSAV